MVMIWAAAIMSFFGFFRAGEITTPTLTSYDPRKHLAWGDVTMDDPINPSTLRIRLKFSKTDQFGKVRTYTWERQVADCVP